MDSILNMSGIEAFIAIIGVVVAIIGLIYQIKSHSKNQAINLASPQEKLEATVYACHFKSPFKDTYLFSSKAQKEDTTQEKIISSLSNARILLEIKIKNKGSKKITELNYMGHYELLYFFLSSKIHTFTEDDRAVLPDLLPEEEVTIYVYLRLHFDSFNISHSAGTAKIIKGDTKDILSYLFHK